MSKKNIHRLSDENCELKSKKLLEEEKKLTDTVRRRRKWKALLQK